MNISYIDKRPKRLRRRADNSETVSSIPTLSTNLRSCSPSGNLLVLLHAGIAQSGESISLIMKRPLVQIQVSARKVSSLSSVGRAFA